MTESLRDRVNSALGDIYEVGREVGRGGMGVVFSATDRKLRRGVAIKVLPPEMTYREDIKVRFLREAQTAAQLSHPNIVPIYSVEERQGIVCFVMALVTGESVGSAITRQGALPIPEVVSVLSDVAEALSYAHGRGIVHRDIKPDNILIDEASRRALVTDFGIARAAEGDSRLTLTGVAVGTPAYMSPEQAMGDQEIDGRSDLYSLAIVGYQMLTGTLPFKATNTPAMLMKHLQETAAPIGKLRADAPPSLINALERAMAKKPHDRHESAAAFKLALTSIGAPLVVQKAAPLPAARPASKAASLASPPAWQHKAAPRVAQRAPADAHGPPARLPRLRPENSRSAVEAANAGWRSGLPVADNGREQIPEFMPTSWRETRADWDRSGATRRGRHGRDQGTVDDRIRLFRKRFARTSITVAMLAAVNLLTAPAFLWFFFPMIGMGIGLAHQLGSLWADGVKLRDVFGREASRRLAASAPSKARSLPRAEVGVDLATPDVLAGPHGPVVRRAANDRQSILDAVARLSPTDREMIPDVVPTMKALAERVGSLASALHNLDADVRPAALEELDARIAAARLEPEGAGRDHRIQLLERQRATLSDLAARRSTLTAQLDGAALLLQNMRLDLAALQSAGVQSVLNDVSGATQEARALSRDIAHVLEAAREVR